jgi:hypothetical protein
MLRASFEKGLKDGKFNRMAAAKEAERRASEDLKRAQQRSLPGCKS